MKSLTFSFNILPNYTKKTCSCLDLYIRVSYDIEISLCSRYQKKGTKCFVTSTSLYYIEYIKAGSSIKYNVYSPLLSKQALLGREESKLDISLCKTQEEQQQLFSYLTKLQAKILRFNKQREMFQIYIAEILRRSLKLLNKLDAAEEAERLAETQTLIITDPPTSEVAASSDFLDLELAAALATYDFLNPFQVTLDFVSEMP